jgi:hypothetical protein
MSVINAVRAKIINRMFALIRQRQPKTPKKLCYKICLIHKNIQESYIYRTR